MNFLHSKSHASDTPVSGALRPSAPTASVPSLSEQLETSFETHSTGLEYHPWGLPMTVRQSPLEPSAACGPPAGPGTFRSRRWGWKLAGLLAAGSLLAGIPSAFAQQPPPTASLSSSAESPSAPTVRSNEEFTLPASEASGSASYGGAFGSRFNYPTYPNEPPSVGGYGTKARIGSQAGTTVGQSQPITNFDLSPYLFEGNLYLFGEGRIALGNDGKTGGSLGAGGRYFFPRVNSILGASGWIDIDATRGPTFHQWGVNAEFLSEFLDIRGNVYVPYGQITRVTGIKLEEGSQQFIDRPATDLLPGDPAGTLGTYLSFQRRIYSSTALQGFDTLFTIPMPGEFAQTLNLEASAGFYGYEARDGSVKQTYGWRARFDIDLFEHLSHMFLEINNDKAFKTNVAFGADINYWHKLEHRPRLGHSQYNRLAEWVRRNRTTVALNSSALAERELAINPATGRPYVIYQVEQTDQVSHGGDGTLANPFQNLQDAINATGTGDALRPSDFVDYVHGNSVIENNGITIGPNFDGLQVIGETSTSTIGLPVVGLPDPLPLPVVTPEPFDTPAIQNINGNAVTLSSNNVTFAGFDILNVTGGDAIYAGPGINGGNIQEVSIKTVTGGNGVNLQDTTGNFSFVNVGIADIEEDAFKVTGGNANIVFSGADSRIDNTSNSHASHGYAVNVEDAAGAVNLGGVNITDTGGNGIRIYGTTPGSSTARVTIGPTTLTDTVVIGPTGTEVATGAVYIRNHAGTVTFSDTLNINGLFGEVDPNAGGNAFVVEALQSSGSVFVQQAVNITGRKGYGIYVVDSADTAGTTGGGSNDVTFQQGVTISGLGTGYVGDESAVLFQSYSGGLIFSNGLNVTGGRGDGVEITAGTGGAGTQGTSQGHFVAQGVQISGISGVGGTTGISFNAHDIDKENFIVNTIGLTINNRGTAGSTGDFGKGINVQNFDAKALFQGTTTVNNDLLSNAIGIDIETNSTTGIVGFVNANVNNQRGAGSYGVRVFNNLEDSSGVSFNILNVTSNAAVGVSFEDNAVVSIGSGTLNSTGARAIEVFTGAGVTPIQQHTILLNSVSATGADYGIYVSNSEGQFTVSGVGGGGASGGTISGMTAAGAHFDNTQSADLNFMLLTNNLVGVEAISLLDTTVPSITPLLRIGDSTISGSGREGIYAEDVQHFNLQNSVVSANDVSASEEQIEIFSKNDIGLVTAVFNNNNISDSLTRVVSGTDMIYIHNSLGLSTDSQITAIFTNNGAPASTTNLNSITSNRGSGDAAISLDWTGGAAIATIDTNRISTLNTGGQIGVKLTTNTSSTNITYTNTSMSTSGANAVGIQAVFQQASTFNASNNQAFDVSGLISGSGFQMSGTGSTGMNLQFLATGNTITVNNNLFEFLQRNNQGIVFERLTGNGDTNVAIGGNSIYRPAPNTNGNGGGNVTTPTVGIYIKSVLGNINLINSGDNFVQFGNFPFQNYYDFLMTNPAQAGGSTISVNGNLVP